MINAPKVDKTLARILNIDGDWEQFLVILHNPTPNDIFFNLFDPLVVQQTNIPDTPPSFYITASANYNDSVRDFFNSPAWVRRIYVGSQTRDNLYQSIQHIYKDANGTECIIPRIPSLSIGINQFQGWIGQLDFEKEITVFGINQYFQNVLIKSNSQVGFLLIYKQIQKVNILSVGSPDKSKNICSKLDFEPNKIQRWSKKKLSIWDYSKYTPYKQNMFEGLTEDVVRPFDFSMLFRNPLDNKL